MRKVSTRNQNRLDFLASVGLNMQPIVELYGIRFALQLTSEIIKTSKNKEDTVYMHVPSFKVDKELRNQAFEQYINILEDCGFKIRRWYEDFVDEDTGKVVSVERMKLYTI